MRALVSFSISNSQQFLKISLAIAIKDNRYIKRPLDKIKTYQSFRLVCGFEPHLWWRRPATAHRHQVGYVSLLINMSSSFVKSDVPRLAHTVRCYGILNHSYCILRTWNQGWERIKIQYCNCIGDWSQKTWKWISIVLLIGAGGVSGSWTRYSCFCGPDMTSTVDNYPIESERTKTST